MKKTVRFFAKVFLAVSAVTAVLFTIYMTNADSKLIEFIYDKLLHYHAVSYTHLTLPTKLEV